MNREQIRLEAKLLGPEKARSDKAERKTQERAEKKARLMEELAELDD